MAPKSIGIMPSSRMEDDFPSTRGKEKSSGISRACEAEVSDDQQLPLKGAHDLVIETSFLVFAGEICFT